MEVVAGGVFFRLFSPPRVRWVARRECPCDPGSLSLERPDYCSTPLDEVNF